MDFGGFIILPDAEIFLWYRNAHNLNLSYFLINELRDTIVPHKFKV